MVTRSSSGRIRDLPRPRQVVELADRRGVSSGEVGRRIHRKTLKSLVSRKENEALS
jgi:hypothetical protein